MVGELEPLPRDWGRALAIVAHPDDLEYGTASAVARWTSEGKDVSYLLATRGEAGLADVVPAEAGVLREAEERSKRSCGWSECGRVFGLSGRGRRVRPSVAARSARAIRRHRPEMVLTINRHITWGGASFNMADHRNVGLAILDAVRDAVNRWIFPELFDEGHEPGDGVKMVCFNGSPAAAHAVDVTAFLDIGIASLREHRAYLDRVGGDADAMLREAAASTGDHFGCEYAVAFEVIRP